MGQQGDGQEDQERLIGLEIIRDAHTGGLFKNIKAANEKQCGAKVHSESDGDVSSHIRPTTDPRGDATAPERRQDERLIVSGRLNCQRDLHLPREQARGQSYAHSTSSWIDRGNLRERNSDTDDEERDEDPAPDNVGGTTGNERIVEGGGETVRHRRENEAHKGDLPDGAITRQFGLIP